VLGTSHPDGLGPQLCCCCHRTLTGDYNLEEVYLVPGQRPTKLRWYVLSTLNARSEAGLRTVSSTTARQDHSIFDMDIEHEDTRALPGPVTKHRVSGPRRR
jgi:hypothetical protein